MPTIRDLLGLPQGGDKNSRDRVNAEKVQDFLNKYNIRSKDLNNSKYFEAEKRKRNTDGVYNQEWQGYSWVTEATQAMEDRPSRYRDYRDMCKVPELDQSLSIYADNGTQYDIHKMVLQIESDNAKIVEMLEKLFFENLDMNADLWKIFRNCCKFGDEFVEVIVDDKENPKNIVSIERIKKPENIRRIEKEGNLIKFLYILDEKEEKYVEYQPWEIIHFRVDDEEFTPYGRSIFEAGRRTWKKLSLMEDAMMIYRLSRAPERRVFYVDVGNISSKDANKYIDQLKRQFRKKQYINPNCLSLNTIIPLLDGRNISLKEIINEFNGGKENWTYSIDRKDNSIVPGKILWAGETRKNAETVKLTLDDGQTFITTPDHKFMMRDGSYKEAKDLISGESLMPLYRKISGDDHKIKGYELVLDPSTNKYVYTHMISDFMRKNEINNINGQVVRHHIDMNKRNNNPSNIRIMESKEHWKLHSELMSERSKKLWNNEEYKNKMKISLSNRNKENWKKTEYREKISCHNREVQIELHKNNPEIGKNWVINNKKFITDEVIKRRKKTLRETLANKEYSDKEKQIFSEIVSNAWENHPERKKEYSKTMSEIGKKYGAIGAKLKNKFASLNLNISYLEWKNNLTNEELNKIITGITNEELLEIAIKAKTINEAAELLNCSGGKIANKIRSIGYKGWTEYKSTVNHKIISVDKFINEDTGTLTINTYHNFAIGNGVFVKNSGEVDEKANILGTDEDFYIPVRQGSTGTRIETLPGGCLTLDTKIKSLDGNSYTLAEMIEKYKNGEEQWVYSCDPLTGEFAPGYVSWAGITHRDAQIMELTLDNGETVRCTPDHKFPVWGKGKTEAKDLILNDSIISHNTRLSTEEDGKIIGYEKIYDHSKKKWVFTHRAIAQKLKSTDKYQKFVYKNEEKLTTIHHKNFNKLDNTPLNLTWMGNKDHFKYHSDNCGAWNNGYRIWWNNITEEKKSEWLAKTEIGRKKGRENYHNKFKTDEKFRNEVIKNMSEGAKAYISSLTNDEKNERDDNSRKNFLKGNKAVNFKIMNDPEFRSIILQKRGKSISKAFTDERKIKQTEFNNKMWSDPSHYGKVFENSYIRFDEQLLTKFVDIFKQNKNFTKTLEWINDNPDNEFTKYLIELNKSNTGNFNPYRLTSRFTQRFMENYGFINARDFSSKISLRNHRIVGIKHLDYVTDVGTLTIDKEEKYHNYHTFALDCGVYNFNSNLGEIDDVRYFRDQVLRSMGIPAGYLGGNTEGSSGTYDPKSYLSNQEIQFSRTIERVQKLMIKGLEKIAIIQLALAQFPANDMKNFKIKLTPPSNVDQLMDIEIRNSQFGLIQQIKSIEGFLPNNWIYKEVLGMNDQEINRIKLLIQMEAQMQAQLQAIMGGEGTPSSGGGGGGGGAMGNIAPTEAGGPAEAGGEGGAPGEAGAGAPTEVGVGGGAAATPAPAGGAEGPMEFASKSFVEFNGGNWLIENNEDIAKLIKYIKLYEKVTKDNNSKNVYEHQNSLTRMTVKGEFRGLLEAKKISKSTLTE
jgi:hypothetical protein